MNVMVTGGYGFLGRHVVPALRARGHRVSLLVRDGPGPSRRPEPEADAPPCVADLRNFAQTARGVRAAAPDVVIHLAARGATDPFLAVDQALRHNVNGTVNLLRACFDRGSGVRQVVVARTPGERDVLNPYAASKAAAWAFCRMYAGMAGWPIVGAMIFQAYGPGQPEPALVPAAVRAALAGEDFPLTSGDQERDWIHVTDVAEGLARVAEQTMPAGTTVELGRGECRSVLDVVRHIYALAGGAGRPRPGALPDRPGEPGRQIADAAATARRLGWRATIDLEQGLRALVLGHRSPAWSPENHRPMA